MSHDPIVTAKERLAAWKQGKSRGEHEGHKFRGNRWTGGIPGIGIAAAIVYFAGRHGVAFERPTRAVTDVEKLAGLVRQAEAGVIDRLDLCEAAPDEEADLFCFPDAPPESRLPILRGKPKPGSRADKLPKNGSGHVDISSSFGRDLESRGHVLTPAQVPASRLRFTRRSMDANQLTEMLQAIRRRTYQPAELLISDENYIVDGHHRWVADVGMAGGDTSLRVLRVNVGVLDALKAIQEFGNRMGIPQPD
jgi:hypothetical protein